MKKTVVIGTSILGLLLATPALLAREHGQSDREQNGSHQQQGNHGAQGHERSSPQQHSNRPPARVQEQRHEQHAQPHHPEPQQTRRPEVHRPDNVREVHRPDNRHEGPVMHRDVWRDHRAQDWRREHRTWRDRGGYHGYRIPADRFRMNFGRAHWFRVYRQPIIVVEGRPRFQYGGFWISLVDPWPSVWAANWYETDDVYVDYVNDGYYMYNRRHPGIAIAVNISM
jgi:hypothetical protein